MNRETLVVISISIAVAVGAIWLLTFGVVWILLGVGLFISCVVLLFSGVIGPALGCLILCPLTFFVGALLFEKNERKEEIRLGMPSIKPPLPAQSSPMPAPPPVPEVSKPSILVAFLIVCATLGALGGMISGIYYLVK
jgi:hypothetical protein